MTSVLAMARSVLFNILFFVTTTLFVVIGSPFLFLPRSWAMAALKVHARFELFLLRLIIGTKIEVRGREKIPDGPCLVASKHQSAWETFALIPIFRDPALLMKRELFWIPFHGWFSYKFQMIPVDRDKGPTALRRMLREAKKRIEDGREIIIFPEGTRRAPGAPPDYKTGIVLLYDALRRALPAGRAQLGPVLAAPQRDSPPWHDRRGNPRPNPARAAQGGVPAPAGNGHRRGFQPLTCGGRRSGTGARPAR